MSVRGYKIKEIKTSNNPTFNLWGDYDLLGLFMTGGHPSEDGGLLCLDIGRIKGFLADKSCRGGLTQDEISLLQTIVSESDGENYVQYYCF